ncbi:hypothetical protein [Brevibacillus brevis]|uniref:CdiA C-terminal domain-containing protein n=1 Tax=Brevibacillus brevis TaxID=1393 RepID=UPI0037CC3061
MRENEAAEILAQNGYDIEQNRKVPGTKKDPDYLIGGVVFDCYSPAGSTVPRNVASTLDRKKISKGQTRRIILNLRDWEGNVSELKKQFKDWPIKNLDEVIAITEDKKVIHLLP